MLAILSGAPKASRCPTLVFRRILRNNQEDALLQRVHPINLQWVYGGAFNRVTHPKVCYKNRTALRAGSLSCFIGCTFISRSLHGATAIICINLSINSATTRSPPYPILSPGLRRSFSENTLNASGFLNSDPDHSDPQQNIREQRDSCLVTLSRKRKEPHHHI